MSDAGTMQMNEPYHRPTSRTFLDRGYGFHAAACAPGILALLEPVRQRQGLVLEIGGSFNDDEHALPVGLRSVIGRRRTGDGRALLSPT